MKCSNNSSEKYAFEGEERNRSSWREMCELDLIFTLIRKAGMERDDSGESKQREKEVMAMAK